MPVSFKTCFIGICVGFIAQIVGSLHVTLFSNNQIYKNIPAFKQRCGLTDLMCYDKQKIVINVLADILSYSSFLFGHSITLIVLPPKYKFSTNAQTDHIENQENICL